MSHTSSNPALKAAANWKAILSSGDVLSSDKQAFEAWINSDAKHKEAYKTVEQFWGTFDNMDSTAAKAALKQLPTRIKTAKNLKVMLSLALAIPFGFALLKSAPVEFYLADYHTELGEVRVVTLEDNSRITLNTNTAIDVRYSSGKRLIDLKQGEVLVEVAKNKDRPFIVSTAQGTAQALGTKYLVKAIDGKTSVSVIASLVRVCNVSGYLSIKADKCLDLSPGQGVNEVASTMQAIKVDADNLSSWSTGFISFDSESLSAVLDELARYTKNHIYYNDADVETLKVSGVIPIHDTTKAFEMLSKLLPITFNEYPLVTVVNVNEAAN